MNPLTFAAACTLFLQSFLPALQAAELQAPNILWITAEDMSPMLGCYGDDFATTPNIDKLATESVLYTNAFATAPVCSPSRSCIINGLPATSQGTQQMRSAFPIPDYMNGFPAILRTSGSYTTNNVKTDYNSANFAKIIAASWDENSNTAHWRNRKNEQPFFSIFNLMTSHQSRTMVWPYEKFISDVQSKLDASEIHDPNKVPLPSYYPDTPVIRRTQARFYDCVTAMDKEVGAILRQLEDDGLADDTIVFFYSDHGSGMPRHKRALLDSGMQVALIIRFPEKYKHLAPSAPGTTSVRLVSFDDFAPTVLSLSSADVPTYMEGRPFLGKAAVAPRNYVYGHRDRVDEVHDLARSVRDIRYLYIRNYMPHHSYNQPSAWPDLGEIRPEFYREAASNFNKMSEPQKHFVNPSRPLEELYDCLADPENLNNLAGSPVAIHRDTLKRMRTRLSKRITESRDLGFLPEALAWEITKGTTQYEMARSSSAYNQKSLVTAASLVGNGSSKDLLANLMNTDPGVRYWGAVGFSASKSLDATAVTALEIALADNIPNVRIEAANALVLHGHPDKAMPILAAALDLENLAAVQHAARTVELLGDKALGIIEAIRKCDTRMKVIRPPGTSPTVVDTEKDKAMFISFSTETFLKRHSKIEP